MHTILQLWNQNLWNTLLKCTIDDSDAQQGSRTTGLGSALEPEGLDKVATVKPPFTLSCGNSVPKGEKNMG